VLDRTEHATALITL